MKIIASTTGRYFLVEMEEDEIAKACGHPYASRMANRPAVGQEINVTDAYSRTTEIIAAEPELTAAKEKLERVISAIETMQTLLKPKASLIKAKMP